MWTIVDYYDIQTSVGVAQGGGFYTKHSVSLALGSTTANLTILRLYRGLSRPGHRMVHGHYKTH